MTTAPSPTTVLATDPTVRRDRSAPAADPATKPARIAAIIVTWNRRDAVSAVLGALAQQRYPLGSLDVVVVDNSSTDGTTEALSTRWRPERIVENPTDAAHEPAFRVAERRVTGHAAAGNNGRLNGSAATTEAAIAGSIGPINAGGFRSLTIIRNIANLGGCGGFNTGLAFVERFLDSEDPAGAPDYAWLVDDDVDLPPDALRHLVDTAESDTGIGLVGSRAVDFHDRRSTIETTIYFDFENGWMGPDPTPAHPLHAEHARWIAQVGGTRGERPFRGTRDVDVVSACSLLARWSGVKKVGLWDYRYFIYCDDADWCLRFAKAGYRVVCDLDAVVYHTPWIYKLTPVRGYYSQRNMVWMIQKMLRGRALRRAMFRRLGAILLDSRKAATHCRLFHGEVYRRTAEDIVRGRGGKCPVVEPASLPVLEALDQAGALGRDKTVMVMCSRDGSIAWADELRARVSRGLAGQSRAGDQPRWVYMVREGVPDPERERQSARFGPASVPPRIFFRPNRRSKWRSQKPYLRDPPVTVVFDQANDFPVIRSRANIHVDRRRPEMACWEPDGIRVRLAFFRRWLGTMLRSMVYAARTKPYASPNRYG